MADMKKLLSLISELQVAKSRKNDFQHFSYRNAEDILVALKPLMVKYGILPIITDSVEQIGERYYVKSTVKVFNADDGTLIAENSAYAREPLKGKQGNDDSQTTGSTSSYARKYALTGMFNLSPSDEPQEQPIGDPDGLPPIDEAKVKREKARVSKLVEMFAKRGIDANDFSTVVWNCKISQVRADNIEDAINHFEGAINCYRQKIANGARREVG